MSTLAEIEAATGHLPRTDKLHLMETLWTDLSRDEAGFESPAWHGDALAETEQRLAEGREQVFAWESVKAELRGRTA